MAAQRRRRLRRLKRWAGANELPDDFAGHMEANQAAASSFMLHGRLRVQWGAWRGRHHGIGTPRRRVAAALAAAQIWLDWERVVSLRGRIRPTWSQAACELYGGTCLGAPAPPPPATPPSGATGWRSPQGPPAAATTASGAARGGGGGGVLGWRCRWRPLRHRRFACGGASLPSMVVPIGLHCQHFAGPRRFACL